MLRGIDRWLASLVLWVLAAPLWGADQILEVVYPPSDQKGELSLGVTYKIWIPDGVKTLRGVIVHQHGCGTGACKAGITAAHDVHWQALARKWDCALLGPSYHQEEKQDCRLWCDPRNGSRRAFQRCLKDFAQRSEHPELVNAPLCLWGHSGGGFWASLIQTLEPQRIVAIWFRSGTALPAWEKGEIPRPEIPEEAYRIPAMLNPGGKEKDDMRFKGAYTGSLAMFHAYRAKGAPIGFAPDPRTSHECGDARYLAIPFFDACLAARLPDKGSANPSLKPIDLSRGYLAPLLGNKAEPYERYREAKEGAVWLPTEAVATAWAEYVQSGVVKDVTPPAAPRALKASRGADGVVTLTWEAEADFESGLGGFILQRNGKDLQTLPEKPVTRYGRPLFQGMTYHDTPLNPVPEMRFVDKEAQTPGKLVYRVIALNSAGLRSAPSGAVEVP